MGYSRAEIEDSLTQCKYDDVFATYLLLGRKNSDVSYWMYSNYYDVICFFQNAYDLKKI